MFADLLETQEMAPMKELARTQTLAKGTPFILQGAAGDTFYLMLTGKAQVRRELGRNKYKVLATVMPGQLIGEFSFLGIDARSADVIAVQDCKALAFECKSVHEFVSANPDLGLKIYRQVVKDLVQRLVRSTDEMLDALLWALDARQIS